MSAYFYRCEAKGIQPFVLQGRRLRDVIGGSALIKNLMEANGLLGRVAEEILGQKPTTGSERPDESTGHIYATAAGGATLWFQDQEALSRFAARWPMEVEHYAPGVHLVQAWCPDEQDPKVSSVLAERLAVARNHPRASLEIGTPIIDRPNNGSRPAVKRQRDGEFLDAALFAKQEEAKRELSADEDGAKLDDRLRPEEWSEIHVPVEIDEIAGSTYREYIAVIHVDGNGVGELVRGLDLEAYARFSAELSKATFDAVREATSRTLRPDASVETQRVWMLPARPVVISGDDVTIICRADRALAFVEAYAEAFQRLTQREEIPRPGGLTASAGIAFVRASHPFRMAYDMAERLTGIAKRAGRMKAGDSAAYPSMVSFCRVTTSLEPELEPERELAPQEVLHLTFGPYHLDPKAPEGPHLDRLQALARMVGAVPRGPLRELLRTLEEAPGEAPAAFARIEQVRQGEDPGGWKRTKEHLTALHPDLQEKPWAPASEDNKVRRTPWFDALTLRDVDARTVGELEKMPLPKEN